MAEGQAVSVESAAAGRPVSGVPLAAAIGCVVAGYWLMVATQACTDT